MRRIINSTSVSICVQFALGTHLFAASNDLNSNSGNPGIFGAILGVVVPVLIVIAIGGCIYVWLRRNKPSLTDLFPRRRTLKNWDISPPTYTSSPPSPMSPRGTVHPDRSDPLTEPDRQLERDEYTLESIDTYRARRGAIFARIKPYPRILRSNCNNYQAVCGGKIPNQEPRCYHGTNPIRTTQQLDR